jgi:hypothetical protein
MLVLNRSISNREYILINVLKALASFIMCVISMYISYRSLRRDILHYLQMECFVHSV